MGQNVNNYGKQGGAKWFIGGTINLGEETYESIGIFGGGGATGTELPTAVTGNFLDFRTKSTNTDSADVRGLYWKHLFSGASASGEAARIYSEVNAAGAASVNGAHITVGYGTSGTCTGQSSAIRSTFMAPAKVLGGTNGSIICEIWAEGATSNMTNGQFIRFNLGGDSTGAALLDDNLALFSIDGVTVGSAAHGNIVDAISGDKAVTHLARIRINNAAYYLMLRNAV
jgi:hypothetical protein